MRQNEPATREELEFAERTLRMGWHLTTRQLCVLSASLPLASVPTSRTVLRQLRAAGTMPVVPGSRAGQSRWPASALVDLGVLSSEALAAMVA
jgi:hypothetical protein